VTSPTGFRRYMCIIEKSMAANIGSFHSTRPAGMYCGKLVVALT